MNAKEFERFLVSRGAAPASADAVTRRMRAAFKVETGGRGLNAHNLQIDECAWLLLAYAGAEVASRADEAFERLLGLHDGNAQPGEASDFVVQTQILLRKAGAGVVEIRVCRNFDVATIRFDDGRERIFLGPHAQFDWRQALRSEGVISGGMLRDLAAKFDAQDLQTVDTEAA